MSSSVLPSQVAPSVDEPVNPPVWWQVSGPEAVLVTLTLRQCLQLIGRSGTGRLSFRGAAGTIAVLTSYQVSGFSAILGPVPAALVRTMADRQLVLFQVDRVDVDAGQGWSVVLVDRVPSAEYVEVGLQSLAGRQISASRQPRRRGKSPTGC